MAELPPKGLITISAPKPVRGTPVEPVAAKPVASSKAAEQVAPHSSFGASRPQGIGVAETLARTVATLFAPLKQEWQGIRRAIDEINAVIEEAIVEPIVAGAVEVYAQVKAAIQASADDTESKKGGAGHAPLPLVLGGGVILVSGVLGGTSDSPLGSDAAPVDPAARIPLLFLSTWGVELAPVITTADAATPTKGSGIPHPVMIEPMTASFGDVNPSNARYGHHVVPLDGRAAGSTPSDVSTSHSAATVLGGQTVFSTELSWSTFLNTTFTRGGNDEATTTTRLAMELPQPGESIDLLRFVAHAGGSPERRRDGARADDQTSAMSWHADRWSRAATRGPARDPAVIHTSDGGRRVADPTLVDASPFPETFPALPLPIFPGGVSVWTQFSLGPRHADRIHATIEGGNDSRHGSGRDQDHGSQQHGEQDERQPDFDRTDPEIHIG